MTGYHSLRPDPQPMALSTAEQFDMERMKRTIDEATDTNELRNICKLMLRAWYLQKAATSWVMQQGLQR